MLRYYESKGSKIIRLDDLQARRLSDLLLEIHKLEKRAEHLIRTHVENKRKVS